MADINPYEFKPEQKNQNIPPQGQATPSQGYGGPGPEILPPIVIEKPTSVTVFGVLNCVFGGMFFVCVPVGFFFILMAGKTGDTSPELNAFDYISLGVVFGLSVWEIITGIGLLKFVSWARQGTILYAVCEIIWILFNIVMHFTLAGKMPVPEGTQEFQMGYQAGYYIGQWCGFIFTLIYPVLLLIFMNTKKVKNAFAAIGG